MKKVVLIMLSCVIFLNITACTNKTKNEETVLVKENLVDYRLNDARLINPINFTKDGVAVELNDILYEDLVTWLAFDIKNDTEKPIKVLTTDLSVNGIMCNDSMLVDVEPKAQKTTYLEISNEWFYGLGIEVIKEFEFNIRVLDETSNEIMSSEVLKANTDAPKKYVQKYDDSGNSLFNESGVVILSKDLTKSKLSDDFELGFYIENNTDSHVSIIASEVYVNEQIFEPTFIVSVGADKKAIDSMLFSKKDLNDKKIKEIKSLKASFKGIDKSSQILFETSLLEIPLK